MKRILAILLTIITTNSILFTPFTVSADSSETYVLDELGMSIDIPTNFVTFTRDIDENDPNLAKYNENKNELLNSMESNDFYLLARDEGGSLRIHVSMRETILGDYNLLSPSEMVTKASSLFSLYETNGVTIEKHEFYQHS